MRRLSIASDDKASILEDPLPAVVGCSCCILHRRRRPGYPRDCFCSRIQTFLLLSRSLSLEQYLVLNVVYF